MSKEVYCSHYG